MTTPAAVTPPVTMVAPFESKEVIAATEVDRSTIVAESKTAVITITAGADRGDYIVRWSLKIQLTDCRTISVFKMPRPFESSLDSWMRLAAGIAGASVGCNTRIRANARGDYVFKIKNGGDDVSLYVAVPVGYVSEPLTTAIAVAAARGYEFAR